VTKERRCPTCGGLVSPDAEWCGQCFSPLDRAGDTAERTATDPDLPQVERLEAALGTASGGLEVDEGRPTWVCPVCQERNPIEAATCTTCGTPFTRLFEEREERPDVEPQTAAVWSMVFPGLGHWKLGRRADAIARIVMFAWAFGALLILLVSRFGKGGLGPTMPLFLLFLGSSVANLRGIGDRRPPDRVGRSAARQFPDPALGLGGGRRALRVHRQLRHLAGGTPVTSIA
jgi:ribosomal protein L40E